MKGKGGIKVRYRLSPNEVEQLSKEETARRRKLRLVQVREQAKVNAARIRDDVRKEKMKLVDKLTCQVKNNLEKEKLEKLHRLEQQYENSLKSIGTAHKAARNIKDNELEKAVQGQLRKEAANRRYQTALKNLRKDKALKDYDDNKHIIARHAALETEALRAAEIAALPPPPPDPWEEALKSKPKAVPMTDMNAFSTTHYHIPEYAVVKAGPQEQTDARLAAEEEDFRLKHELKEKQHTDQDRIVRARIRGNEALRKEHLRHEYSNMLQDLSFLQRADRRRRQEEVADLPKQVFLPPDRRQEDKENKQRDMEKAFEDMYLADKHPPVLMSLDTQTPPDTPNSTESHDPFQLPTTLSLRQPSPDLTALKDVTNVTISDQTAKLKKNDGALMKLFNRIKEQKEEHASRSAIETSQIVGETVKPGAPQPPPQLANGLSPLSEYSALETCSLPSTTLQNHSPTSRTDAPQQVHIVVRSPRDQSQDFQTDTGLPSQSDKERKAWQDKIIKLEEKQKELDGLINKFKQISGINENTEVPIVPPPSTISPTQVQFHVDQLMSEHGISYSNQVTSGAPHLIPDHQRDHRTETLASHGFPSAGQTIPNGLFHAVPVQIDGNGLGVGESGYYSGIPGATFRGYQGFRAGGGTAGCTQGSSLSAQDMATHSRGLAQQADHVRKVREYQQKILESSQRDLSLSQTGLRSGLSSTFGTSTNSDLDSKVKEYHKKILMGNAERRNFLEETRANIERQRKELYRKYPLTMGRPDTFKGTSTLVSSSLDTRSQDGGMHDSLADRILADICDPLQPRSLDTADILGHDVLKHDLEDNSRNLSQMSANASKSKLERVKKSLLFEDPDESLTRTPGRDMSLLAPSDLDEGDITLTSSSERGSPNLSKSVRSDGSAGGMSLITRARETGSEFDRRQQELKKQLEEVQRQKQEILERYQLGQQKIQDSKTNLKSKLDTSGFSHDMSRTWKSSFSGPDSSYASLPTDGNLRPASRTAFVDSPKEQAASVLNGPASADQGLRSASTEFSIASDFPKTFERFNLMDSTPSAGASLGVKLDSLPSLTEKPLTEQSKLFSMELEEESLVSGSRSPPVKLPDRLFDAGSLSLEEESLSPESKVSMTGSESVNDKITWSNLLTGVPGGSPDENDAATSGEIATDYIGHELSTIFEVDTPTTQGTRQSGQFVTLSSTRS
ncbi:serine-rich adhesin for platelets-like [Haliotis asinina]|uniref:serine-rich adhesin for platelets-like n=1 Tax=Haliotis asinina TaxID=109174 RepID=UPI003531DAEB